MGGLSSIDLAFEGIGMTLAQKKKKKKKNKKTKDNLEDSTESSSSEKHILDGSIRGRARPGRMLAIMGPSGT